MTFLILKTHLKTNYGWNCYFLFHFLVVLVVGMGVVATQIGDLTVVVVPQEVSRQ
jgi:hypothetical protein